MSKIRFFNISGEKNIRSGEYYRASELIFFEFLKNMDDFYISEQWLYFISNDGQNIRNTASLTAHEFLLQVYRDYNFHDFSVNIGGNPYGFSSLFLNTVIFEINTNHSYDEKKKELLKFLVFLTGHRSKYLFIEKKDLEWFYSIIDYGIKYMIFEDTKDWMELLDFIRNSDSDIVFSYNSSDEFPDHSIVEQYDGYSYLEYKDRHVFFSSTKEKQWDICIDIIEANEKSEKNKINQEILKNFHIDIGFNFHDIKKFSFKN